MHNHRHPNTNQSQGSSAGTSPFTTYPSGHSLRRWRRVFGCPARRGSWAGAGHAELPGPSDPTAGAPPRPDPPEGDTMQPLTLWWMLRKCKNVLRFRRWFQKRNGEWVITNLLVLAVLFWFCKLLPEIKLTSNYQGLYDGEENKVNKLALLRTNCKWKIWDNAVEGSTWTA